MDIDPAEFSIIGFIQKHGITNEKGEPLDFKERRFLYDPICDWSPFQVYKKCAQVGMSVTMVIKALYACEYKKLNIIHTFPTESDASEFVNTKTNKILQANGAFKGIQSDNVERKEIGDRFLYYKGTISKSAALATTADLLIQDEKDRSDQERLRDYQSRLQSSKFKWVWTLSNPSVIGAGVDIDWNNSDKKEWFVTCKNGHAHPMSWPESIDQVKGVYICSECKVELSDEDRRMGDWIATGDPKAKFSGYHMTLLAASWIPASYIIEQFNEGKNNEFFFNFVLGEPYSPGDTRIEKHAILDNWTPKNIITGKYFLGVDVGNIKHYVLGSEKGIVQIGTFTEWHKLDKLLLDFNPEVAVIDAMPDNTMAHHYKDTYRQVYLSHFVQDKQNNTVIRYGEDDKRGLIFSDRNRVIDRLVGEILEGKILYALPSDKDFREYVKHCGDIVRVKKANTLGVESFVWDSLTGEDHYLFATLYYWLARQIAGNGEVIKAVPDKVQAIVHDKKGDRVNLEEFLQAREYDQ